MGFNSRNRKLSSLRPALLLGLGIAIFSMPVFSQKNIQEDLALRTMDLSCRASGSTLIIRLPDALQTLQEGKYEHDYLYGPAASEASKELELLIVEKGFQNPVEIRKMHRSFSYDVNKAKINIDFLAISPYCRYTVNIDRSSNKLKSWISCEFEETRSIKCNWQKRSEIGEAAGQGPTFELSHRESLEKLDKLDGLIKDLGNEEKCAMATTQLEAKAIAECKKSSWVSAIYTKRPECSFENDGGVSVKAALKCH